MKETEKKETFRRQTYRELAQADKFFNECCQAGKVEPTRRQYSKFKLKKGKAYKASLGLKQKQEQEAIKNDKPK